MFYLSIVLLSSLAQLPSPNERDASFAFSTRTATPPAIDGRPDDAVWQTAQAIGELRQIEPEFQAPGSERTEVRFLHDTDALYMLVRCFDREPERILATSSERDANLSVDDRVEIIFDTFHDRRSAFFFQINAAGSKGDALITDNGQNFNKPWDGIWDGAARIDAEGWTAELALPFKTLAFQEGATVWGFNIERYIGRKREEVRWANVNRDYRLFNIYHAGELRGLEGLNQGIGIDVVPFFVAHAQNDRVGNDRDLLGEPGVDVFYKLIPSLTFSLTVNTDFAETEVDSRQINLTRFPTFFPERRDFFLQDAGVFQVGSNSLLPFFSRRIGLDENGAEVPILAGAKLTGRAGKYGIGILDVVTDESGDLERQNLFASRITRDVGEQSTIGLIATHGNPRGGPDNTVYGVDGTWRTSRFRGDKNLILNGILLRADSEDLSGDEGAMSLSLFAPSDTWSFDLAALEIQKNFVPALGFVPRTDIRRYSGEVVYEPRPEWDGVRQLEFSLQSAVFTDTDDELETVEVEAQPFGVTFESGDEARLELSHTRDELTEDFEISEGVVIPIDTYEFTRARLEVETAGQRELSGEASFEFGDFFDGRAEGYGAGVRWQPGPAFAAIAEYERNEVALEGGDFDTRIARLRTNVSFTPELSWNSFVQWDSESDTYGIQSRLRWIPRPHQEFFLVFNEELADDSGSLAPVFQDLSFKATYALRF
jgi:hypothetical protein